MRTDQHSKKHRAFAQFARSDEGEQSSGGLPRLLHSTDSIDVAPANLFGGSSENVVASASEAFALSSSTFVSDDRVVGVDNSAAADAAVDTGASAVAAASSHASSTATAVFDDVKVVLDSDASGSQARRQSNDDEGDNDGDGDDDDDDDDDDDEANDNDDDNDDDDKGDEKGDNDDGDNDGDNDDNDVGEDGEVRDANVAASGDDERVRDEHGALLYCVCLTPYDGRKMVGCDMCDDW